MGPGPILLRVAAFPSSVNQAWKAPLRNIHMVLSENTRPQTTEKSLRMLFKQKHNNCLHEILGLFTLLHALLAGVNECLQFVVKFHVQHV